MAADLLSTMRKRHSHGISYFSTNRAYQLDDLRFYGGNSDNGWQWPDDVKAFRGARQGGDGGMSLPARPCLTINHLPQHVLMVANDIRQNMPGIEVVPESRDADEEVCEFYQDQIREIEYRSDSDIVYGTASQNQLVLGEGYWRVVTRYVDDMAFEQDIYLERIRNSFCVYMDPLAQDPCGSDANWCIITEDMPRDAYEAAYPNASKASSLQQSVNDPGLAQWVMKDGSVRVAEYFYVEEKTVTIQLFPGSVSLPSTSPQAKAFIAQGVKPLNQRKTTQRVVRWVKTNGYEILEETEWLGKYIPVVRVVGNEIEYEGKVYYSGIVRNAKNAQMMYNYWASTEAEMLSMSPKAPFVGYSGQFEGFERKWNSANQVPWPYLEVNGNVVDQDGRPLPLPQRVQPPMPQTGLIQAKIGAAEDIKAATGQYSAALGQTSNERTGKAILARERQADTGTYHYIDNLSKSVRHTGRILIDLIPKLYDTERVARLLTEDGKQYETDINPAQTVPMRKIEDDTGAVVRRIVNPGIGRYGLRVTAGKSYLSRRQDASDNMAMILQANPDLWPVAGDIMVKNMDWPGAKELSDRLQRMVPPELLQTDETPEMQRAQQQIEQLQQQLQQAMTLLEKVPASFEAQKLKVDEYNAETKRIAATKESLTPDQLFDMVEGVLAADKQFTQQANSGGL
jgi:hypothetical protein